MTNFNSESAYMPIMIHTPGPWTISKSRQPNGWEIIGPANQPVAIEPWHGDASHALYKEIYEANARLIAAAPELLKALRDYVERHEAAGPCDGLPEYEAARAAIAKATCNP